jgi:gas vesicle protein GvpN
VSASGTLSPAGTTTLSQFSTPTAAASGSACSSASRSGTGSGTASRAPSAALPAIGRPAVLLHGDHEFGSSDLVGRESGYRKSRLVDNYISSVVKLEEEGRALWTDNRITTACRLGQTIIYDEFNRSKAEANNPFLSILSEGVLNVPRLHGRGEGYISVHRDFRAIFTSNPSEYAGVHRAQDALLDRVITIELGHYDRDTEIAITSSRSGLDLRAATLIVDLVRLCRAESRQPHYPTIRACIAIGRVLAHRGAQATMDDDVFLWTCTDILGPALPRETAGEVVPIERIRDLIRRACEADFIAAHAATPSGRRPS